MAAASKSAQKLKELREEAGLSVQQMADALGMKKTTYQYNEDEYKKPYFLLEFVNRIAAILTQHGVALEKIMSLAGLSKESLAAGRQNRTQHTRRTLTMAEFAELDVRAGMGGGAFNEADLEIGRWQMPADLFRGHSSAPVSALKIITVFGDSMEPDLPPGCRVVVDIEDRVPSPPGVFVLWNGFSTVCKRIEPISHSDPPRIRVMSDNPRYSTEEVTAEEAQIQGRVVGRWRWM